jgi:hypothetical protein
VHVDTVVTSWMPLELAHKELVSIAKPMFNQPVRVGTTTGSCRCAVIDVKMQIVLATGSIHGGRSRRAND